MCVTRGVVGNINNYLSFYLEAIQMVRKNIDFSHSHNSETAVLNLLIVQINVICLDLYLKLLINTQSSPPEMHTTV